ncbi:MarR family winged helix-turn-helix transcriptional regulator [Agromyces sp. SYSU T00194]|uniref:MarR family winged helix-turn-helix transcriptional regulator n=1 Tax=Agromyces chitinivorans TaxID=3158560 RepID=UPI00339B9852
MALEQPDLGALVGYRLKHVQSLLRARMDGELRPLGLTTPQYVCLELLSRTPGASNSELARGAFVTRQTMNALLVALEHRGLIVRAERAPTGRALPTKLTPAGAEMLARAADVVGAIESRMIGGLSSEQVAGLQSALAACAEALEA